MWGKFEERLFHGNLLLFLEFSNTVEQLLSINLVSLKSW